MNTKTAKRTRDHLTPDELNQLFSAVKAGATRNVERDTAILTLLANHGMRISELCDLLLSDINLSNQPTIYIRHEKDGAPSMHPLYKSDTVALRKWLGVREGLKLNHGFLFCSEQRTQLSRQTINLMIATVGRKAGLEHLRLHPHSFRRTCASQLINRGGSLIEIQDWLGHRSFLTTRRYCELAPDRFKNFKSLV
jgi:type 1 fimbriae regulatory protein FimB